MHIGLVEPPLQVINRARGAFTKADAAISSGQARSRLDRLVILSQSFD